MVATTNCGNGTKSKRDRRPAAGLGRSPNERTGRNPFSPLSRSICSLAEPAFGPRVFRNLDVEGHDNGQGKLEPRGRGALAGGKQARKGRRPDSQGARRTEGFVGPLEGADCRREGSARNPRR